MTDRLLNSAAYRIAFTYAAVFLATTLMLGAAVYFAADAEFRRQRDASIVEEAAHIAGAGTPRDIMQEIAEREKIHASDAFSYALFDAAGRRIAGRLEVPAPRVGFGTIVFHDPEEGADPARAQTLAVGDGYRLTVAVDSEPIERIDATILALFGGAFIVILLVGACGALILGSYLRRRLASVSDTAAAIAGGSLDRRVPISPRGDEFDQLGAAVNAMLDRIAALLENLRQVSSDVAHDLRTPLVRLRNQLEQVGRVQGAAERAIAQGDALLSLFASILRIAEVEGGGAALAAGAVDLSALALDVAETYQPALADSGHPLRWSIAAQATVTGDRELLAQIMVNLLDNARVHTPSGTRVSIDLSVEPQAVRLAIADEGPGVPPHERERILRRFARSDASRTTPGNGLGLSLVDAVVAAHGGRLMIEDASPGLRAVVILPRLAG